MGTDHPRGLRMKTSRTLLISLGIILAATGILMFLFGGRVFALLLFLPLGFLFRRRRPPPEKPNEINRKPIEPS